MKNASNISSRRFFYDIDSDSDFDTESLRL